MEVSGQLHDPPNLSPGEKNPGTLGGPQSRSGCSEEKNSQPPPGIEP
jgi:hypothetical protein